MERIGPGTPYSSLRFIMLYLEREFTFDAVFDHFHVPEDSPIRSTGQIHATYFIIRKSPQSIALVCALVLVSVTKNHIIQVDDWYETAVTHPRLFSNDDNWIMQQKHRDFVGGRNDQSVFSVLSKLPQHKDSVLLMPDCYQCGPFQDLRSAFRSVSLTL